MRPFVMLAAAALSSAAWASAQAPIDQVTPRRTRDYDERRDQGRCEIRVRVDDEVNVYLRDFTIALETVRGQRASDAGSECSQPLPRGQALADFRFEGIDGRGDVRLIEPPSARNGFRAWVKIRDQQGGSEEYHFRLSWGNLQGGNWGRDNQRRDGGVVNPPRPGSVRLEASNTGRGAVTANGARYRVLERASATGSANMMLVEFNGEANMRVEGAIRGRRGDDVTVSVERIDGQAARGELRLYLRRNRIDRVEMEANASGRDFRLDFTGDR